jgi:UDP-4-amino-4,6-dideoxy-N-acetyl-beta-L-altrosamine transaminase
MSKLAIAGGTPVREKMLPYGRQVIDDADIDGLVQVLRSDWLTTGPKVNEFEERFAAEVNAKYAIAISNGTAALHAAAFAAQLKPGDEALVTPMTFAASANCVRYQGGKVMFSDVRPDTLNLDVTQLESKITSRTKAVVVVDYTGQPADLAEIRTLARKHNLLVIEDAAHAVGATYHGQKVGSISDLTTFSFHPVKQITTAEGGIITTNDEQLATRLRLFRNHGITSDHRQREKTGSWFYEMVELGYNYRLTDLQCALGISQLKHLSHWLARRREIAARYTQTFKQLAALETPVELNDRQPAWHLYVLRFHLDQLRVDRAQIFSALRAENIGVNVHYIPVHWHPYYQKLGYRKGSLPVAESNYERMISLPMWHGMTDVDVQDVIEAVTKVVTHYQK